MRWLANNHVLCSNIHSHRLINCVVHVRTCGRRRTSSCAQGGGRAKSRARFWLAFSRYGKRWWLCNIYQKGNLFDEVRVVLWQDILKLIGMEMVCFASGLFGWQIGITTATSTMRIWRNGQTQNAGSDTLLLLISLYGGTSVNDSASHCKIFVCWLSTNMLERPRNMNQVNNRYRRRPNLPDSIALKHTLRSSLEA